MALPATAQFQFKTTATANMLNGGGFDIAATFGITDATTDSNTANTASPVVSSATYTFVASDALAWMFIAAGTNWTKGFYQIASVAGGKATLSAAIGAALIANPLTGDYDVPNTAAGCATVGTPTSGTIGVDYSQQDAADASATDYASVGASTTLTSISAGFKLTHIGNFFHLATTGTGAHGVVGWYEITAYASTSSVTIDRTCNDGTALVAGTGKVGGALDLAGSLSDSFYEAIIGGNTCWYAPGTYTLGGSVSVVSASATAAAPIMHRPYNALRGDTPTPAQRVVFACGANFFFFPAYHIFSDAIITGTGSTVFQVGVGCIIRRTKILNSSTSAARLAVLAPGSSLMSNCEAVSQNGNAFSVGSAKLVGCYGHDSASGFLFNSAGGFITNCISESNSVSAVSGASTADTFLLINCTLYGSEAKIGSGVTLVSTATNNNIVNCIIYGFATGVSQATAQVKSNTSIYTDYFNNTTDVSLFYKDRTDLALDPQFAGASQLSGSTASTSGSVLTDANANFSTVTDNVDYCRIVSGTGKTAGIYLITAHTTTTLTLNNAPGTNATADGVWVVPVGHNFAVGANMKAGATPGLISGSETTSYLDLGAAQRIEPATPDFAFMGAG